MVRSTVITAGIPAEIVVKLEYFNPGHSVKDRAGLAMIEAAEKAGLIHPDTIIMEPTSGNTGIALAMICAARGYHCMLVMPETMSRERRMLFKAYGAELILTPGADGMGGAIQKAEAAGSLRSALFHPAAIQQSGQSRDASTDHRRGDLARYGWKGGYPGGGCGHRWHHHRGRRGAQGTQIVAQGCGGRTGSLRLCSPEDRRDLTRSRDWAPVLFPAVLNTSIYDEIIRVTDEDAMETARHMAKLEGLLVGISAGAATWAALQVAARPENAGKLIVVIIPDYGERYLSTALFAGLLPTERVFNEDSTSKNSNKDPCTDDQKTWVVWNIALRRALGAGTRPGSAQCAGGDPALSRSACGLGVSHCAWLVAAWFQADRALAVAGQWESHRHRDSPGCVHRTGFLHRSWHGGGDRRDGRDRPGCHPLPWGDAGWDQP